MAWGLLLATMFKLLSVRREQLVTSRALNSAHSIACVNVKRLNQHLEH